MDAAVGPEALVPSWSQLASQLWLKLALARHARDAFQYVQNGCSWRILGFAVTVVATAGSLGPLWQAMSKWPEAYEALLRREQQMPMGLMLPGVQFMLSPHVPNFTLVVPASPFPFLPNYERSFLCMRARNMPETWKRDYESMCSVDVLLCGEIRMVEFWMPAKYAAIYTYAPAWLPRRLQRSTDVCVYGNPGARLAIVVTNWHVYLIHSTHPDCPLDRVWDGNQCVPDCRDFPQDRNCFHVDS